MIVSRAGYRDCHGTGRNRCERGGPRGAHGIGSYAANVKQAGRSQFSVVGDVSDAAVCSLLAEQVVHHFGGIDILVNNAGTIRRAPAAEHSDEDRKAVIDTNITRVPPDKARREAHAGAEFRQGHQYCFRIDISGRSPSSFLCRGQRCRGATDESIRQ
jgi:NAD(P)-dependent dehydrogenase (short-subunit alcohol dehydrogenase family)